MKIILYTLAITTLIFSEPQITVSSKWLIMEDLKAEHEGNEDLRKTLSMSLIFLAETEEYHLITISFQSIVDWNYKARLYLIIDGEIRYIVERTNHKYHAGTFRLTNDLRHIKNEVLYEILLPVSSVAFSSTQHEYFEYKNDSIISLVKFYSEERDCSPGKEVGELIARKVFFKSQTYSFRRLTYSFDCENFEWEDEIKGLKLVKEEIETR